MQLKVKVEVAGRPTSLSKFLNSINHTDTNILAKKSIDIIHKNMRQVLFANSPEPEVISGVFKGMVADFIQGTKTIGDIEALRNDSSMVWKFNGDDEHITNLYNDLKKTGKSIGIGKSDVVMRNYRLHYNQENRDWRVDFANKIPKPYHYIELHLGGYSYLYPEELKTGGVLKHVAGRDIMLSSYLLSVADIVKMIKKTLLRNMGLY